MACLSCLECCIPEENFGEEPVIDLEKVIRKCAMEQVKRVPPARLSWWEKLCPLKSILRLDIDKSFLDIEASREMTLDELTPQPSVTTVLFKSHFRNETDTEQIYSFKTEKQTKSSLELSLQRGFTFGQTLELDIKLPSELVSGKLGSQLQWTFQRGKVGQLENDINSDFLMYVAKTFIKAKDFIFNFFHKTKHIFVILGYIYSKTSVI